MALTPINIDVNIDDIAENETTTIAIAPSKTWSIDLENGRIGRYVDGVDAIQQYIRKAIGTARNRYLAYTDEYGSEIQDFIGQTLTPELANVEIPRFVREAIMYDDRIADVPSVVVRQDRDNVFIDVIVELMDGTAVELNSVSILHQVANTTSTVSSVVASVTVSGQSVTIYPE